MLDYERVFEGAIHRLEKKRVEGTPPQLGITLWLHLSSSYKRACLPKWHPVETFAGS
jgi:hypothetical protein